MNLLLSLGYKGLTTPPSMVTELTNLYNNSLLTHKYYYDFSLKKGYCNTIAKWFLTIKLMEIKL